MKERNQMWHGKQLTEKDYRWNFIVNTLDFAFFSLGMTFGSLITIFPVFAKNLGASNFQIGLIPAIANLGWGIPAILGAKYAERYPKKLNLVLKVTLGERLPYFFMALISFFVVPYDPKLALYLSLAMLGVATFSMGFLGPPWMSMIEKVIDSRRRGTYFAMGNGLGAIMGVGGASLARYFLESYPFPSNFGYSFFCASIFLMISFVFLALTREVPDENTNDDVAFSEYIKGVKIVLYDKNFRNYIINRVLDALMVASSGFITVYLVKKLSMPDEIIANFTAILLVSQGLSSFALGPFGDRFGHKYLIVMGRLSYLVVTVLLLISRNIFYAYLSFVLIGLVNSARMVGDFAFTLDIVPKNRKELYMGVLNLLISPFSFLAPLFGGKLADIFGYETLFYFSLIIGLASLIFLIKFVQDPRRKLNNV
jgi:MFS family permease